MPEATIEDAIALAVKLHNGQVTLDGQPYILHPLRIMLSFADPADDMARIAAVLHDVVEDCGVTTADLAEQDFPTDAIAAIEALSRRQGEAYAVYIYRVARNPLAVRVKIADLLDNLDPKRPSTALLKEGQWGRYFKALNYLRALTEAGI